MDTDEWGNYQFDEWEIESYENQSINTPPPVINQNIPPQPMYQPNQYPEVEIGSSSDEDAPPLPESTKLARENLELRQRVEELAYQSKTAEIQNTSLKNQLFKCRNLFKRQIKSMKKAFK